MTTAHNKNCMRMLGGSGEVYCLEFIRRSVETMECRGFVASDIQDKPMTTLPALFRGAFLANHRFVKADLIDEIYAHLTDKTELIGKLAEMYNEPINHRIDLNRLTGVKPLSWFTGRTYESEPAPVPDLGYTKYVVKDNDTLWGIAKKLLGNGKKYKTIMTANGMTSTIIRKGDVLNIPKA